MWWARLKVRVMRLVALEPSSGVTRTQKTPRPFVALALSLVAAVIASELFFHVEQRPLLQSFVELADLALIVLFVAWVTLRIRRDIGTLAERLVTQRIDVLVAVVAAALAVAATPRVAGGIVVGRMVLAALGALITTALGERAARLANLRPPQTAALTFFGVIALGTPLLTLPAATTDGRGASVVDALFTITSAVCVTGLAVVDTGTYWTPFGQVVILLGIQTGAIGIMVLGAAFIVVVGGGLAQRQQVGLSELLEVKPGETLRSLITAVSATTLAAEAMGAFALFSLWLVGWMELPGRYDDVAGAMWWSVFHSVSAFCNAGFALQPDSLSRWVGDPVVCGVFEVLITVGGLGFAVLADVHANRRFAVARPVWTWNRLQLQTRVVIVATLALDVVGAVAFLFFEFNNALAPYGVATKLNAAWFQAVTTRTAGFNTVPFESLLTPTILIMMVWMFVGAGPGSTGGGIKTTTATTVVLAVRAMLRGRVDVELFGRTLPKAIVYRSISIVLIGGGTLALFLVVLTATQGLPLQEIAFETVSAMGTVGLSLGATTKLDPAGRVLVALLMYAGRLGPLTVALAVGERLHPKGFSFPEGRMAVG